ncbi:hypothetical protein NUH86_01800 [Sphingobium sp. JS3065]|uniref:hypothetical protein n=1 Tax=Sphingobium sp. JS3065 TaxID=2970925 RepID=UPI002263B5B0|nr:hypothetical protein [Sphingobium sp. JS3065]UZW55565.1 hypothetical protein NUH86_01800 [Sphingobium sp. JS3065]
MANEILFAGGRLDSVTLVAGTPTEDTTAGSFDSTYADCSLFMSSAVTISYNFKNSSFADTDVVTGETGYVHFEFYKTGGTVSTGAIIAGLYDSSGFPWLAIRAVAADSHGLYYNSGTGASPVWTLLGSAWSVSSTVRYKYDLKYTLGSPHSAEVSLDNSLVAGPVTFTQASLTSVRSVRHTGHTTSFNTRISQLMASRGISTINGKVKYSRASGAGTNSGWTGAYTNVNEAVNSDATVDSTTSAGVKQTYAMGDVTVPTGFAIKAVFHFLRAKNDGSSPSNIKSTLRSASTDYSSGNLSGIGTSFGAIGMRYDNDPATSSPWTQSGWNAAEAGYESAA